MNNILKEAQKEFAYIQALRRRLHQYPELSLEEKQTSAFVKGELDKLGIPYEGAGPLGVIACIEGSAPGSAIALRADMDALPIQEETGLEYASQYPGVSHACGHDAHTAMLLGAGKILKSMASTFKGKVFLCFQQAEENISGAKLLVPCLKGKNIKTAFGIHVSSQLETGAVSLREGASAASSDIFCITVKGKGGHGSRPDLGADPNSAAAAIITELARAKAMEISPFEPCTIYVGMIQGGFACNVIPETCTMKGTIRALSDETRTQAQAILKRVVKYTAEIYQTTASLKFEAGTNVLFNDVSCVQRAKKAAGKLIPEAGILESPPMLGSEDFSEFSKAYPSVFVHVGSGNKSLGTDFPHHNPKFNIDEEVLSLGAALHVQYALDFLGE